MKTQNTTAKRIGRAAVIAATLAAVATGVSGCRGDRSSKPPRQFFPDLDDQLKWRPQSQTPFFKDGRSQREPVGEYNPELFAYESKTVAFGRSAMAPVDPSKPGNEWAKPFVQQRADLLKDSDAFYEGRDSDGTFLAKMPVEVTAELIKRGRERYGIYCAVCHGYSGDGKGMVGAQWAAPLPNYHDDKYKKPDPKDAKVELWKDGYIFHVARYGVITGTPAQQKMPGYAHALSTQDTWAVVAYIRALQESRSGVIGDVPEGERQKLEAGRAAAIQAQQPPAAPAAPADPAQKDAAGSTGAKGGTP